MNKLVLGLGVAVAVLATGCMTGQDKATLDAIAGATQAPYVEAFIEYPGPSAQWAGPPSFVVHVIAKEDAKPEIIAPPAWSGDWATTTVRKPASQVLTGEEVHDKLGDLASAISDGGAGFQGCLYPIHVRLIRADGNVVDQRGCRGQSKWASEASDALNYFMGSLAQK